MEGVAAEPPVSIAPYAVLEIEPGASPSEVRTAYKKLALRYHPGPYFSISFTISLSKPSDFALHVPQTKRFLPLKPPRILNSKKSPSPMPFSQTLPAARVMTPPAQLPTHSGAMMVISIGPTSSGNNTRMPLPWTGFRSSSLNTRIRSRRRVIF